MQGSDNVTLARAIQQYGVKIKQLWLNGYDQTLLNKNSSLMQGVYLNNTGTLPFEAANTAKYGNTYSGMQAYIAAMKKYEPDVHLQRHRPPGLAVGGPASPPASRRPATTSPRPT